MPEDAVTAAITGAMAAATADTDTGGSDADTGAASAGDSGHPSGDTAVGDGASGETGSTGTGEVSAEKPAVVGDAAKTDELAPAPVEDEFAAEHGIKSKDSIGRENKIPYSKVKRINENAVKKAQTNWESTVLAPERAKVTEYETRLQGIANVEHIMFNEQARFVEMLREIPGYAELLPKAGQLSAAGKSASGNNIEPSDAEIDWSQAPGPDSDTGYSNAGLTKLLGWTVKQAAAQAVAATEARLSKRYEPMETMFQRTQENRKAHSQMMQATDGLIGHATEHWEHFKDNHAAITQVLVDDAKAGTGTARMAPQQALEAAYHKVVFGKLTTDRNKIRQEILAEMKKAPAATSAGSSAGKAGSGGPTAGTDPIEAVIREQMAKLK